MENKTPTDQIVLAENLKLFNIEHKCQLVQLTACQTCQRPKQSSELFSLYSLDTVAERLIHNFSDHLNT